MKAWLRKQWLDLKFAVYGAYVLVRYRRELRSIYEFVLSLVAILSILQGKDKRE
jgi:hypothetical protein